MPTFATANERARKSAELDHGRPVPRRAQHDGRQQERRRAERAEHARAVPAPVGALDDPERERAHARDHQRAAERVRQHGVRVARLAQHPARRDQGEQADRHVQEEDPAPSDRVHQQAAERRPERGRDGAGGAPDRHGGGALVDRELRQQQRERGRHEDRARRRLQDARGHEQLRPRARARTAARWRGRRRRRSGTCAGARRGPPAGPPARAAPRTRCCTRSAPRTDRPAWPPRSRARCPGRRRSRSSRRGSS